MHHLIRSSKRFLVREQTRLRAHFRRVLAELAVRDVSHLHAEQRATRSALLAELARYAGAGRFPRNLDYPRRRVPYFVDAFGTRCAVAHLIESTGGTALVAQIARSMNNAFVFELAAIPDLQAWLEKAGITVAEAARIQPSYCHESKAQQCFCNGVLNSTGVIEATFLSQAVGMSTMRIDATHGDVGMLMTGQQATIPVVSQCDAALIQINSGFPSSHPNFYGNSFCVKPDGTLQARFNCEVNLPTLTKADAIAAMQNRKPSQSAYEGCVEYLQALDQEWAESSCDNGGCSMGGATSGSPFFLGASLAFTALLTRRRRRQRRPVR